LKNLFGSKEERFDEACEYYKQAATQYKLGKDWERSAAVNLKAARLQAQLKSYEAIDFRMEAGNMMRKINTAEAIKLYDSCCESYCLDNRISSAARLKKKIAEIYEEDLEYSLAAKYYQEAVDLYEMEGESSM